MVHMEKFLSFVGICILGLISLGAANAEGSSFDERKCLGLTTRHSSHSVAINRLMATQEVQTQIKRALEQDKKILHPLTFDQPVYRSEQCYWSLSLYEGDAEKLFLLGTYFVQISKGEVFRLSDEETLLPISTKGKIKE